MPIGSHLTTKLDLSVLLEPKRGETTRNES